MQDFHGSLIDEPVSIFIVDDHPIVIEGIQTVIEKQSNYRICGHGTSIQDVLTAVKTSKPTILISDISLKKESGLDLIGKVKAIRPHIKILMMSMHDEVFYIEKALRAGANGYILKSDTSDFLIEAIGTILNGKRYLNEELEAKLLDHAIDDDRESDVRSNIERLTEREKNIFLLIGSGKNTKDIANTLHISTRTVDSHKENIKKKLGKNSTNEVLGAAIEWSKLNLDKL